MPLNPYFLQGSPSEQRLVQDLINEQLKIYGQDVVYLPRQVIKKDTLFRDIVASKFNDSFRIEAYLLNYQGFEGQGDILSKFGVKTTDSVTFIISKERYEDFVVPLISSELSNDLLSRPREGDLIYLPLDNTIFEIKYVEGKKPFYQLNNLYVYQLSCEVLDLALDENIDTNETDVDASVSGFTYTDTTLTMIGASSFAASATANTFKGYYAQNELQFPAELEPGYSVSKIDLINDGTSYLTPPTVSISTSPSGNPAHNATAVAIMTSRSGQIGSSIDKILIVNPGLGYTQPPTVTIRSSTGTGGIATAVISTGTLMSPTITSGGSGYALSPTVGISSSPAGGSTAQIVALISNAGVVTALYYSNAGAGYTSQPTISMPVPGSAGLSTGNYIIKEVVKGVSTGTTAFVESWDSDDRVLKVSVVDGSFAIGETIVGMGTTFGGSNANYVIQKIAVKNTFDPYSQNEIIEEEADQIIDFSERNPFGEF
jgi:hypothetical protein